MDGAHRPQSAPRAPTLQRNRVLEHAFPRALSLRAYLAELLAHLGASARDLDPAARGGEIAELVDSVIVGISQPPESLPRIQRVRSLPPGERLEQSLFQTELVQRAVAIIVSQGHAKDDQNVLARGFRRAKPGRDGGVTSVGPALVEQTYPSSIVNLLQRPAWCRLLEAVGDGIMMHLLLDTHIFSRLPNACCLQLTGVPLAARLRAVGRRLAAPSRQPSPAPPPPPPRTTARAPPGEALLASQPVPRWRTLYIDEFHGRPGLPRAHALNRAHRRLAASEAAPLQEVVPARDRLAALLAAGAPAAQIAPAAEAFLSALHRSATVLGARSHALRDLARRVFGAALAVPADTVPADTSAAALARYLRALGGGSGWQPLVLPLLNVAARAQSTCPYAGLLHQHCPLPYEARPQRQARRAAASSPAADSGSRLQPQHVRDEAVALLARARDAEALRRAARLLAQRADQVERSHRDWCVDRMRRGARAAREAAERGRIAACRAAARLRFLRAPMEQLLSMHCSPDGVVAFAVACLRHTVPQPLVGSPHNWAALERSVARFVALGRHDACTVADLMRGMRLSEVPWLRGCSLRLVARAGSACEAASREKNGEGAAAGQSTDSARTQSPTAQRKRTARRHMLRKRKRKRTRAEGAVSDTALEPGEEVQPSEEQNQAQAQAVDAPFVAQGASPWLGGAGVRQAFSRLLFWIFTDLLVPVLRAHFYATDVERSSEPLRYYRKAVWARVRALAYEDMRKAQLEAVSLQEARASVATRPFGTALLRVVPKAGSTSSYRPIMNLSAMRRTFPHGMTSPRWIELPPFADEDMSAMLRPNGDVPDEGRNEHAGAAALHTGQRKRARPASAGAAAAEGAPHGAGGEAEAASGDEEEEDGCTPLEDCLSPARRARTLPGRTAGRALVRSRTSPNRRRPGLASSGGGGAGEAKRAIHGTRSRALARAASVPVPAGAAASAAQQQGPRPPSASAAAGPRPPGPVPSVSAPAAPSVWRWSRPSLSINQLLAPCFHALTFESKRDPGLLGCAVQGADEVHRRLVPFARKWQGLPAALPLHVVSVDIQRCFDHIQPRRLFRIASSALRETSYLVCRMTATQSSAAEGLVRSKFLRRAAPAAWHRDSVEVARRIAATSPGAVITDGVVYPHVERAQCLRLLHEHLFQNLVRGGGRFFRQQSGIPQGSILSTLLCNLYYGHIERNVLEWQVKRKQPLPEEEAEGLDAAAISSRHASLLIRLTDDYLLLTTRPHLAHWFARTMAAGMPRWGCEINPNKSRVNFHAPMPAPAGGDSPAGPAVLPRFDDAATNAHAPWLPWCGFLLHPETLELRSSYDRVLEWDLRTAQSLSATREHGQWLLRRMKHLLQPKAHPLLLDPLLNSPANLCVNIHQLVLVAAARLAAYVPRLPQQPCAPFLKRIIREIISYAAHIVQRKTARCATAHSGSRMRHVQSIAAEPWLIAVVELVAWDAFAQMSAGPPGYTSFGAELLDWMSIRRAHASLDAEALAPKHVIEAAREACRDHATVHLLHSLRPGRPSA